MAITINSTRQPEGKSYQHIFITVNVDGDDCKFTHSAPSDLSGDDLQSYVDSREDFYKVEILRNMYGGADAYNKSLKDFEKWVSDGCKNAGVKGADIEGNEYVIKAEETISKKTWVDTH
tara:strand:+ start:255 stop:611 length:357 start_codon:yes stop_codon:yes gene_type:complete